MVINEEGENPQDCHLTVLERNVPLRKRLLEDEWHALHRQICSVNLRRMTHSGRRSEVGGVAAYRGSDERFVQTESAPGTR